MKKIKSFSYLDEYKMFSLFSQMFEGLTYNLTNTTSNAESDSDQQLGPFFSGKEMANTIYNRNETKENKILHDHIFNLFVEKLEETKSCINITQENIESEITNIPQYSFIAIKGFSHIYDMESLRKLMTEMPDIDKALNYIMNNSIHKQPPPPKQTKGLAKTLSKQEVKNNIYLGIDRIFIDNFLKILNFHYTDYIEIQTQLICKKMPITFTAIINNKLLRESMPLFLKKFGRTTQKELVVFGTITQPLTQPTNTNHTTIDDPKPSLKRMLRSLIGNIEDIENNALGKEENEIIIDPIAIYHEV